MVKRSLISLLAMATATPVYASPAYLTCSYDRGDGVMVQLAVVADESQQLVVVTNLRNGRSTRFQAVFSADLVRWSENLGSGSASVENQIDRRNLAFRTVAKTSSGPVVQDATGKCEVQSSAGRIF